MEENVAKMRESPWRELRDKNIMFNPLSWGVAAVWKGHCARPSRVLPGAGRSSDGYQRNAAAIGVNLRL